MPRLARNCMLDLRGMWSTQAIEGFVLAHTVAAHDQSPVEGLGEAHRPRFNQALSRAQSLTSQERRNLMRQIVGQLRPAPNANQVQALPDRVRGWLSTDQNTQPARMGYRPHPQLLELLRRLARDDRAVGVTAEQLKDTGWLA